MRVIAGKARRLRLKTIEGLETRPTTDRIKETLFNIINYELSGKKFLDLFSGSGAIGIEALSRGAYKAYFVENNKKAIECIKSNLSTTNLKEGYVIKASVIDAIDRLENLNQRFDIVFMDPPYDYLLEKEVLNRLKKSLIIYKETLIIVEASLNTDFSYVDKLGYRIVREKLYRTNKHIFLKIK